MTVTFTDHEGNQRWASGTLPGTLTTGAPVPVRFSPDDVGSRDGVVLG